MMNHLCCRLGRCVPSDPARDAHAGQRSGGVTRLETAAVSERGGFPGSLWGPPGQLFLSAA